MFINGVEALGANPGGVMVQAFARLFGGLELSVVSGFHKDKISKAIESMASMGLFPPEMMGLMNLSGMREFLNGNVPPEAIEEMGPIMKQVLDILDVFVGVESFKVEGCVFGYEGSRWDDDRKELDTAENAEVVVKFQNLNPFALLQYMTADVRGKLAVEGGTVTG